MTIDTYGGSTRTCETTDGDHTYCLKGEISDKVRHLEKKVERMSRIIKTQEATINLLNLKLETDESKSWRQKYLNLKRNHQCECTSKNQVFSIQAILKIDEALEFYTGFKNRHFFTKFSNLMKPAYKEIRINATGNGRPRSLTYLEELFIVFSRFRLNMVEDDIASKFSVSRATVSNVWTSWIDLLNSQLEKISQRKNTHPIQIIVDCVELSTETPSRESVKSDTFSEGKAQHTVKGLVGVTPDGVVAFVSNLYGGGKSDRVIFEDCGILDFLAENDEVIADGGFDIGDLLELKNAHFRCVEPTGTYFHLEKDLIDFRNRVEIVVEQIRNFGILKSCFPNTNRLKLNKIWKICCLSLNFLSDPLFDDPLF